MIATTGSYRSNDLSHRDGVNLGPADGAKSSPEPRVLLATKLHPPTHSHRLISRSLLVETLRNGSDRKLTLLDAPAGWGKSSLLAQWIAEDRARSRFAWVSLDPADNDPARFWTYVLAAMLEANATLDPHAFELIQRRADLPDVVLPTLLNELVSVEEGIVLVLDDYQVVTNSAIHDQLAFVIDRKPGSLRLVLATRSDPALPLARLRAAGDLLEVRAHDLRFVETECAQMLNDLLGLGLTVSEIEMLCRRTEGWAAGLYLAALSLESRLDAGALVRAFAGDDRHVVDYLSAEVLANQPTELRAFLVRTSILDRLSGPLCDTVLQASGSVTILERIERANLFLVPLDNSRTWYRYHHLFAELLYSELMRTEPDLVSTLHRRAAEWFVIHGCLDEAVHHRMVAGDVCSAKELIAANWGGEYNRGRLSTVSRWLDRLPHRMVVEDSRLCLARAWIALDLRQLSVAARWIGAAEQAFGEDDVAAEVVLLGALLRFKLGDVGAAVSLAQQAIGLDLGESVPGPAAAYCVYGAALYWSGATAQAQPALTCAVELAEERGNHAARTYALGYLATIAAQEGKLVEAEALVQRSVGGDRDADLTEHFVDMMASIAMAIVLTRRQQIAAADEAALRAVVLGQRGGGNIEVANALLLRAVILDQLGDPQTARRCADQARKILADCPDTGRAQRLVLSTESITGVAASPQRPGPGSVEELTTKELEIVRLLSGSLTRREIAAHLYVSLNTVKTHQRSLFRKLDVSDRRSAVERARKLGLI